MPSRAGAPNRGSPSYPELPRQPVALAVLGLCASHPQPDLWTSRSMAARQAAARICRECPVQEVCRDWAASLPLSDTAVYGGLLHAERARLVRVQHDMSAAG